MQFSSRSIGHTPPTLATLVLLSGLSALSMNLYLPSLPFMAVYFDTDYKVMQLSIALYLLVNALMQILIGPIADKAGRRPVLLWGLGLFLLATLGCIYAPNVELFLFFRMSQAVIVVGLVLSRAAVRDMFEQDQAASMIGYVTMGMALVPMIAPSIGGALDSAFGWRAVFWFLAVAGAATMALCYFDQGETAKDGGVGFAQQLREYPILLKSLRFWGYVMAAAAAAPVAATAPPLMTIAFATVSLACLLSSSALLLSFSIFQRVPKKSPPGPLA